MSKKHLKLGHVRQWNTLVDDWDEMDYPAPDERGRRQFRDEGTAGDRYAERRQRDKAGVRTRRRRREVSEARP